MVANHPSIGCENMPKKNLQRKDMETTEKAVNQMLSDSINKIDKVLDGAYDETYAKYHNGKQSTVVVVGLTHMQMTNMRNMLNANVAFMDDQKQTASVTNRIARAKRVIGRIDGYINGVVVDRDGNNRIMTRQMRKDIADQKAKDAQTVATATEQMANIAKANGMTLEQLMDAMSNDS